MKTKRSNYNEKMSIEVKHLYKKVRIDDESHYPRTAKARHLRKLQRYLERSYAGTNDTVKIIANVMRYIDRHTGGCGNV